MVKVALLIQKLGKLDECVEAHNKALVIQPGNAEALFNLSTAKMKSVPSWHIPMMNENGISIKSSHISFQAITNTEETIRRMKYLNIKHAIVPSVPEKFSKDFASNFEPFW